MSVRTLVVDDDPDMRLLVSMAIELSPRAVEVVALSNGDDVVEKWRRERPDVIVMDVRMPVRDGVDIAEEILVEDPQQRIVLFSAFVQDHVRERAEAVGVCEVLEKYELRDLPDVIHRCATGT